MEQIDQFLDQIIDEKGYTTLDDDARAEIKRQMTSDLLGQVNRMALNELSEEKLEEFSKKLDDPNFGEKEVQEFLVNAGVDLEKLVLRTMVEFKMLYGAKLVENEGQAVSGDKKSA